MQTLGCGHAQVPAPIRLCAHLIGAKEVNYARCLRGVGLEFDLACSDCGARFKNGEVVEWTSVCAACYDQFIDDAWDFAWIGEAQVLENLTPFDAALNERDLPVGEAVLWGVAGDNRVFGFANGELLEIGAETRVLMRLELPIETGGWRHPLTPRLGMSKSGRFAALVNDYGRFGTVTDLQTRAVTLDLDRGDYDSDTTPFPIAFFQNEGRELVVHATAWNRLDISDPQTGELLTAREFLPYEKARPAHYLDYFHGRLHVSLGGEWILDDGWVWHPVGVPAWWSLLRWVKENRWESEDGASRVDLVWRSYYWDKPMCWVGDERIAIAGIGSDDEAMIEGARIFDLSGQELNAFAGPKGEFYSDGTRLFSVEEDGLEIWNIESGTRTGRIDGFRPQFQIEGALIEINGQRLRSWSYSAA